MHDQPFHSCSRCFTVTGKGFKLWAQLRALKRMGHIIWEKRKLQDGQTLAILSRYRYPGASLTKRKVL